MAGGSTEIGAASVDEDGKKRSGTRNTRARTGCERCRAKRRKCDESKPACQRCADADAVCQYVTRLTFLEKNSQTVAQDTILGTGGTASSSRGYSAVQFVDHGECLEPTQIANEKVTPPRIDGAEAQSQSVVTAPDTETAGLSFVKEVQHQTLMDHRYRSEGETVHSGGLKVSGSSTLDDLGFGKEKHPSTGGSTILLKHYGRLVSQWLDVYDLGRTFGLLMPQLAMVSPSVLTMVLELSAASAGSVIGDRDRRNHIDLIQESPSLPPDQLPAFSALQMLISFVFSRARLFVESVPDTWGPMFTKSRSQPTFSIFSFTNTSHRRLWCNTVALLSRLEIAYSLLHEISPTYGPEILRELVSTSSAVLMEDSSFQEILDSSLYCLSLLGDAMCLCLDRGEHDATSPFSARSNDSRFDRWNTLLNQLRKWHGRRVVELRALVELEDHESTFPVVLFSSSAGMLANAIYHTAMSLLLSRQPRDVALCDNIDKDWAESAEASRIWHARRVCGIAVNSTEQYAESWDPCMIAAFFCAAKCMTEQAQQKDLIACLEAIKTAGWRVDKLIHKLHREWGL